MAGIFEQPDDAARPLTREERRDLIPSHIASRDDLNETEQENIVPGQSWALVRRRRDTLSEKFILDLHKRMFGEVWRWAGHFRQSERNREIPFYEIRSALRQLLDDTKRWIEYKSYPADESRSASITAWSRFTHLRTAMADIRVSWPISS